MFYILGFVAVMLALVIFGPPVTVDLSKGSASHNGFGVKWNPTAIAERNQDPEAVLKQEKGEWKLLWLYGTIVGAGVMFLVAPYMGELLHLLPIIGALVAAVTNRIIRELTLGLDLVGHHIEILVAESKGWEDYRRQEIIRMLNDPKRKELKIARVGETVDEALERAIDTVDKRMNKWYNIIQVKFAMAVLV